ncbi:hypothetical protein ACQ4PT_051578 [Festuca glaucescens]
MAVQAKDADVLRFIEEMTSDVDSVQERVLAEILAQNAGTEYLSKCGRPTDRATFRAKVPVVSYEALKSYIQRNANGDRSPMLSTRPVTDLVTSSGTSAGECRMLPNIQDVGGRLQHLHSLLMPMMNLHLPGLDKGKALHFLFVRPETRTPGGLTVWPLLTSIYKSEGFRNRPHDPFLDYTSPTAAIVCPDTFQSMYAQMLCGLCQRHQVLRIGAVFATGLLRAVRFLQLNWEQLAADIEAGALTPRVNDESVREAVAGILRPDPELRVSGFHNSAPQFQFVRRANALLSVDADKTDEAELQRAVERALALLRPHGASVAEYTSRTCTHRFPGHYVVYWELLLLTAAVAVDKEILDGCCLEMEEALNTVYRQCRVVDGSIGPLEIRVVRPGTFEDLMDYTISRGGSINQYKTPRCVTFPPAIKLLDSCVVSSHFNAALPRWTSYD